MPERCCRDSGCKEAVCVDAGRVYDSCADKDCAENMRVYFTDRDQMLIDHAISVRPKSAEVLTTCIDVEALPFNRGYYSCDLTFYFEVTLEVFSGHGMPCTTVCGIAMFSKKVILFGGEGGVKVFRSEFCPEHHDRQEMPTRNMPRCAVQVAEPVVLSAKLIDVCDDRCSCGCCGSIPESVERRFGGCFVDCRDGKTVLVTLGVFTIVQLIRNVQMLMPVYDFCMPSKECTPNSESPCDLFRKMTFPVDEFFPPKCDKGNGCGC